MFPCYGDPSFTYCDAEKEIQNQLKGKKILGKIMLDEMQEKHDQEYAEYKRLKEKFEGDENLNVAPRLN